MDDVERYHFANEYFGPLGEVSGYCDYCDSVHNLLNFGADLNGDSTLICSDRMSDARTNSLHPIECWPDVVE